MRLAVGRLQWNSSAIPARRTRIFPWQAQGDGLVELVRQPGFLHLRVELAAVGLNAEHGLIEKLQLRHRELLWQQLKTYQFEAN